MSSTDFRLDAGFFDHVKTKRVKLALQFEGIVCVIKLFSYATRHRPDGILGRMTIEDIEAAVDWSGTPGRFVQTLMDVRFLDLDPTTGQYSIHNWLLWNPWVATSKQRSEQARWAAIKRWSGERTADLMVPTVAAQRVVQQMVQPELFQSDTDAPQPVPEVVQRKRSRRARPTGQVAELKLNSNTNTLEPTVMRESDAQLSAEVALPMDRLNRQSVINSMGADTIPPGVPVLAWQMLVTHLVEKRRWSTSMLMIVSAGCKALVGQGLNEEQMLSVIRGAITRNTFDLPQVHAWQEQNRTERFAHKKIYGPRTNQPQGQGQGVVSRVMRPDRVAELEAQIIGNTPKAGVA